MPPITKSPSYLIRNQYFYCFRMNAPVDLQKVMGKKELRYSLHTCLMYIAERCTVSLNWHSAKALLILSQNDNKGFFRIEGWSMVFLKMVRYGVYS